MINALWTWLPLTTIWWVRNEHPYFPDERILRLGNFFFCLRPGNLKSFIQGHHGKWRTWAPSPDQADAAAYILLPMAHARGWAWGASLWVVLMVFLEILSHLLSLELHRTAQVRRWENSSGYPRPKEFSSILHPLSSNLSFHNLFLFFRDYLFTLIFKLFYFYCIFFNYHLSPWTAKETINKM